MSSFHRSKRTLLLLLITLALLIPQATAHTNAPATNAPTTTSPTPAPTTAAPTTATSTTAPPTLPPTTASPTTSPPETSHPTAVSGGVDAARSAPLPAEQQRKIALIIGIPAGIIIIGGVIVAVVLSKRQNGVAGGHDPAQEKNKKKTSAAPAATGEEGNGEDDDEYEYDTNKYDATIEIPKNLAEEGAALKMPVVAEDGGKGMLDDMQAASGPSPAKPSSPSPAAKPI
eukprot:TRINITY_DN19718_c0_g1_i1.p1 TRINITY_DN19718_c0_g1~~TRINITY_DN19718_c0_g1_i1.p1  ORF type:complete len:229 (-),score=68.25 TRINITY_DN19718_c0_g1_i1:37-723(-)